MPNSNVFTIKENSVSTQPSVTKLGSPSNFRDQMQSPFARSQSFNNYIKYRNNMQNSKQNFSSNYERDVNRASDSFDSNRGAFSLQTVPNPTPCCVWGQSTCQTITNTSNSAFQTQNNSNTNTCTQFAPQNNFPQNTLSNRPWPIRRSDSFSPGNVYVM